MDCGGGGGAICTHYLELCPTLLFGLGFLTRRLIIKFSRTEYCVYCLWKKGCSPDNRPVVGLQSLICVYRGQLLNVASVTLEQVVENIKKPCPGPVRFDLKLEFSWTKERHPKNYPDNAHWGDLCGAVHNER